MRFTEETIEKMSLELAKAGVDQKSIETWIETARKERESSNAKEIQQANPSEQNAGIAQPQPESLANVENTSGNIANQLESLAGLGKGVANMAKSEVPPMVARGASIAMGQAAGGLAAPGALKFAAVPIGGAIAAGATDVALQNQSGKPYQLGQTLEEMAIGTIPGISAIPGGMATARNAIQFVPKALQYFVSPLGFRTFMTLAGGKTAKTMIDEDRVPTAGEMTAVTAGTYLAGKTSSLPASSKQIAQAERMRDDAITNTTVREWLSKGGAIDPALSYRDSVLNRGLSTMAGSKSIQNGANEINYRIVNKLAREDMGFPQGQTFERINFTDLIVKKSQSLRDIESLPSLGKGISFKDQVNAVRTAREKASNAWKDYRASASQGRPSTEAREQAKQLTTLASNSETKLESMLVAAKQTDLVGQWKSDRKTLATIYGYRDALIEGNISAQIISDIRSVQKRFVDGNFELIGRFHQTMPKVMREITDVGTVSQSIPVMLQRGATAAAALAGAQGLGAGPGVSTAVSVAGALTPEMSRKLALNPFYQRVMAAPRYGADDPGFATSLARFSGVREMTKTDK